MLPVLYSFRRCPYAMRARLAIAASGQRVRLREILLRDKPQALRIASPKATVPVLVTHDAVIDESLDIMLWALRRNDPEGWLDHADMALIARCEAEFKPALDRYKYANRYEGVAPLQERDKALVFIAELERRLHGSPWLGGDRAGLSDMAILTFVRQFAHVDIEWFNGEPYPQVQRWLHNFLTSPQFGAIMQKYPVWQPEAPDQIFPETP